VVVKAKTEKGIVSEAKVVPVTTAALGFPTGGRINEVLVKEGDRVEANQVLMRLDSRQQAAAVAQAEAALKGAQARFDELKAGARPQEIAVAEAGLAGAQAAMQKLQQGADQQQLIAARADLANAEAALKQAQAAYDRAGGASNPFASMLPTSLALEQTINSSNAARARLAALQDDPHAVDLAMAKADIQRAQAQLDLIKAGTRPETLAAAESDVASAKAALDQARIALAKTELRSPFAGLIASLDAKVGEQVGAGVPMLRVGDCSSWQIETTDLTELNIARVREGDAATITFDALPELKLSGTIDRIRMFGENKQGDIVYTVVVKPGQHDERLRWNMTAKVTVASK
jgi:multidrug resistance efflux pump